MFQTLKLIPAKVLGMDGEVLGINSLLIRGETGFR